HRINRAHAPWVAGSGASARRARRACLPWPQIGGLGALSALLDVELDRLTVLQGLQPAGLHRGDVHEHVLALLGSDEAVAPVGIEPLDGAACHDRLPPSQRQGGVDGTPPGRHALAGGYSCGTVALAIRPLTSSAQPPHRCADACWIWPPQPGPGANGASPVGRRQATDGLTRA